MMFDLVVSKDYKKMMQENQIELTDWEKATLIYNHPSARYIEKMWELLALKKQTEDEILKEQIEEQLSHNYLFYEKYKENFAYIFI